MRKQLLYILILVISSAFVTEAKTPVPIAFGASYNHAFKNSQNGWAIKFLADMGQRFRLEPEMMYFARHNDVSTLDLNLNLHYRIRLIDNFGIYPLAGVSYSHWGYEGPNASRWGANIGCGAEFRFSRRISMFTEVKVQLVSHETQGITGIGLKYHFQ